MLRSLSSSKFLFSAGRRSLLLSSTPRYAFSTATAPVSFDVDKFCDSFVSKVQGIATATDPAQSSRELRKLVRSKALMFTDMKDNPEKFFMAHRLLSTVGK
jgi:hypothetical protein